MWETIKNNPWKVFAGTSGTLILSIGGFFVTDSRYAHMSYILDQHIAYDLQIQELKHDIAVLKEELKTRK